MKKNENKIATLIRNTISSFNYRKNKEHKQAETLPQIMYKMCQQNIM